MNKKELLENIKKELEERTSDYALDFVADYDLKHLSSDYLGDCFHEFADNNTSIYYSDQRKYFEEHSTECEDALLELYDGDFLAEKIKKEGLDSLLCFAGAIGEYDAIYNELANDEENIKKLLVIRYLLKYDLYFIETEEELNELLDEVESAQELNELLEIIETKQEEKGDK